MEGPQSSNAAKPAFEALGRGIAQHLEAAGRIGIVALAGALMYLTWSHWGNMQIDCGRELYVPAEILRGKLLYRDLWYPFGPLAPYVEAILLKVFGLHFSVLYAFGLLLTITSALVLFEIGILLEEARVGLATAVIFVLQGFSASIFNYIFPYAYAAAMGLTLTLLCAWFALSVLVGRRETLVFAGIAAGLALLCKQEFGAACYVFLAFTIVVEAILEGSVGSLLRRVWQLSPGVALCLLIYGWFFIKLTPSFILFKNWTEFPGTYGSKVYAAQWHARQGLRFIPSEWALLILNAAGALFIWSRIARLRAFIGPGAFTLVTSLLLLIVAVARQSVVFYIPIFALLVLVFPVGMYFVGCGMLGNALLQAYQHSLGRLSIAIAALTVLALTLAVRVLASVMPFGYSIFYDVPLIFVFILALTKCAQMAVRTLPIAQGRAVVTSVLAAEVLLFAFVMFPGRDGQTARLNTDWGAIYLSPPDAQNSRQIIDFILEQKREGREVLLLPEAPMFYALTGTDAPVRWYILTPGILSPADEREYLSALGHRPPAYIVLTARCTKEYGVPYFGIDYDHQVFQWIQNNYRIVGQVGNFRRDGITSIAAVLYQRKTIAVKSLNKVFAQKLGEGGARGDRNE